MRKRARLALPLSKFRPPNRGLPESLSFPMNTRRRNAAVPMFWTRRNKEEHRYYLLPGMGRSNRKRHQELIKWSIVVGILVSAAFGFLLYFLSQSY